MNNNYVIKLEKVSKKYFLGQRGYRSLREDISRFFLRKKENKNIKWALKDVSFELKEGEVLGIIGPNGAGKSTILKILASVTVPTKGEVITRGKVGSLIELSAGFHQELTGRENIYLYSSIKGMSKKEVNRKFDDIVNFSELWEFIDTPIKRYSSGMLARLAFSVSIYTNPDILLIDEVLAVGDISFQRKCLEAMEKLKESDKTIIFVSHNLSAVRRLCQRVIWLHEGEVKEDGAADEVIDKYVAYMSSQSQFIYDINYIKTRTRWGTGEAKITNVELLTSKGNRSVQFAQGEPIRIRVEYEAQREIKTPAFWVCIVNDDGVKISGTVFQQFIDEGKTIMGTGSVECRFDSKFMHPDTYHLMIGIFDKYGTLAYDRIGRSNTFQIKDNMSGERESCFSSEYSGLVGLPAQWYKIM